MNELISKDTSLQHNQLPKDCVMTLKDVVDVINNARNVNSKERGYLEHGKAKTIIEELTKNKDFGQVEKISTRYTSGNGAIRELETFALTKKQAIAAGARLDNTMLMQVINRVEELEKQKSLTLPQTYLEALEKLVETEKEKQKALAKIERDKPKVEFSERIEVAINSINIGSYAKAISKEHGIKVGQNKLFAFLRDNDILIKSGRRKNFPTAKYMENGYFEVKTSSVTTANGIREVHVTLITGRGQIGLINKIVDHFSNKIIRVHN